MTSPIRHTFSAKEKLKSRKAIDALFRVGKSFSLFPFRVFYIREDPAPGVGGISPGSPVQVGVGAAKRNFKRAVDRNRIKRLLREAYRLQKHDLKAVPGLRVFILYTGKGLPELPLIMEKVGVVIKRLNALDEAALAEGPKPADTSGSSAHAEPGTGDSTAGVKPSAG